MGSFRVALFLFGYLLFESSLANAQDAIGLKCNLKAKNISKTSELVFVDIKDADYNGSTLNFQTAEHQGSVSINMKFEVYQYKVYAALAFDGSKPAVTSFPPDKKPYRVAKNGNDEYLMSCELYKYWNHSGGGHQ